MPHCHITIVEIDGGNKIERSPEVSSVGILYPGERLDLVVECSVGSEAAGSHLSITLDAEYAHRKRIQHITNYKVEILLFRTKLLHSPTHF